ncbi:MAG: type II secretion system protein [Fidelibacterota bacterium]
MKSAQTDGFTFIELVISVGIMVTLAAIMTPIYTVWNAESRLKSTEANMIAVKQAFVNHFYLSVLDRSPEFPPAPADSLIDDEWGNSNILYNGRAPKTLFSKGIIPKNSFGEPFIYTILPPSEDSDYGFYLRDNRTGMAFAFEP